MESYRINILSKIIKFFINLYRKNKVEKYKKYVIGEGKVRKGGLGTKPNTPAPPPPKGQL